MSRQTSMHWYFGEDARLFETEIWPGLPQSSALRMQRLGRWLVRSLLAGLLIGVCFFLLRDYFVEEKARMRRQLAQSVAAEAAAWHQQDYELVAKRLDPAARPDWVRWYDQYQLGRRNWAGDNARLPESRIGEIEFLGRGKALVEVKLMTAEVPEPISYREWRLYRNVSGDWLRTSTDTSLWGADRTLKTGSFYFVYQARDEEAVMAVAAEIDEVYRRIHELLGLPHRLEDPPLTIHVQAENVGVGSGKFVGRRIILLSPTLQRAMLGMDDAAVLSGALVEALTDRVASQAVQQAPFDARWTIMYEATKRWLAREVDPFVKTNRVQEVGALTYQFSLNRLPALWQLHERRYVYYWQAGWALTAAEILVEQFLRQDTALTPADLLADMAAFDTWEEFAQATVGMSAGELERSWHTYLRKEYRLR